MNAGKLDKLVSEAAAAEAALPPVPADMTPVSVERLSGEIVTAYWYNGAILWLDREEGAEVPLGAQALYVRADGRG
jgi:hypothetical protein